MPDDPLAARSGTHATQAGATGSDIYVARWDGEGTLSSILPNNVLQPVQRLFILTGLAVGCAPAASATTSSAPEAMAPKTGTMPDDAAPGDEEPVAAVEQRDAAQDDGITRMAIWSHLATEQRSDATVARFEVRYAGPLPAAHMTVALYYYDPENPHVPMWTDGTLRVASTMTPGTTSEMELEVDAARCPNDCRLEAESYIVHYEDQSEWIDRNLFDTARPFGGDSHEELLERRGERLTGELVEVGGAWHVRFTNQTESAIHSYYPRIAFCGEDGEEVGYRSWASERQGPGFLVDASGTQDEPIELPTAPFAYQVITVPRLKLEDGSDWRNNNLGHRGTMCD